MFATINYIEAALWGVIGLGFFAYAARRSDLRPRCLLLGVVFVAFGGSDVVEVQTGAWWKPWWLLVWKASCLVVMVEAAAWYVQRRRIQDPGIEQDREVRF